MVHHIPEVEDFYKNERHDSAWGSDAAAKWSSLINQQSVVAEIAGHFHRDEHHFVGQVPLYVSASVVPRWGRQPSYRWYELANGRLSYRTEYVD